MTCTPATDFTTYWGNALQGIYITWGHSSGGCEATLDTSTAAMQIDVDIRLYGVLRAAESGTVTSTEFFTTYFLFMNPYDLYDYQSAASSAENAYYYNSFVSYDGMLSTMSFAVDAASDPNTLEINAPTSGTMFADIYCSQAIASGKYDDTSCQADDNAAKTNGSVSDYTENNAAGTTDYCTEKWQIGETSAAVRCVRVQYSVSRNFATTDNEESLGTGTEDGLGAVDIDWEYRKYSVTTGWRIVQQADPTADAYPAQQDFTAQNVDFSAFQRPTETYDSALTGLTFAGSAIFAALLASAF